MPSVFLIVSVCRGTPAVITAPSGTIKSPNYPSNYGNRANCIWKLNVPEGFRIQLTFNSFMVESNSRCKYDSVEIRNGSCTDSPLIGKYCGNTVPPRVTSDGRSLYVKFVSDGSTTYKGFEASFASVPASTALPLGTEVVKIHNKIYCKLCNENYILYVNTTTR